MNEKKKEKYTFEEAWCLFDGSTPPRLRLHRLSEDLRTSLAKASTKLPKEIVDWAIDYVIFISSNDEFPAFILPGSLKPRKGAIFLSNCLLDESEEKQSFIIAHEIAHLKLKHKCSPFNRLTEQEFQKQQQEADELARKWLGYDLLT